MIKVMKMLLVTDKVELSNNHLPIGKFKVDHVIRRDIGRINEKAYFTLLTLEIKDKPDIKYPINLHVSIKGIFEFDDPNNQTEINQFLKYQGVNLLYPYLRSMVTNLTINAMMTPIVLPIVDAYQMFKEESNVSNFVN